MQNLLNCADRASTVPNRSSNEFSGKTGALPAQTMTIPVTTGANRDATLLNLGLYRPITGANRGGVFSTCSANNGGDTDVAGVVPAYHGI